MKHHFSIATVLFVIIVIFCIAVSAEGQIVIDNEFSNTIHQCAPLAIWEQAGSHAFVDSVITIDASAIHDSITYELNGVVNHIPDAQAILGFDNSLTFNELIKWINTNIDPLLVHTQIYIPAGVYILNDKLVLHSNISLTGDGSASTILEFQIKDKTTNTIEATHFNKNAIEITGLNTSRIFNVGIEDLTIERCYGELDYENIPAHDEDDLNNCFSDSTSTIFQRNNVFIRNATNCWITGVESKNTNRHHIMIMGSLRTALVDVPVVTDHITISGCYFHEAANHGKGGFGYGVEIYDNCQQVLVQNNIFGKLRHAVAIEDRSKYNVIAYNYVREPYITGNTFLYGSDYTGDIVFHGQPQNNNYSDGTDDAWGPSFNLVEGNSCRAIWVDSYHGKNGPKNTFLRNRINDIGMHTYGPWASESIFYSLSDDEIHWPDGFCQPRQLIVNNYMKCTHWFLSNFYAFPRRLRGDEQFEKSTKQKAVNFWGQVFHSNKEWDSDVWKSNISYYRTSKPDFFSLQSGWPLDPKEEYNPAQLRWEATGKLTVGPNDPTGFTGIHHFENDLTLVDNFTVDAGEVLIVDKGVTVRIDPGKKIILNGALIASGEQDNPIYFVCSDSTQTWDGIGAYSTSDDIKPNLTLSYCTIKQSSNRALSLQNYKRAFLEYCVIEQNSGGGIFSENGNLQLYNSKISSNIVTSSTNHNGAGLALLDTNAEIISTMFSNNRTFLTGGGAIHISGTPTDSSTVDLFNCYFTDNTGQLSPPTNGWALHSEGVNSVLSLYNCSFVEQGNSLKSSLDNDVLLNNCLFWNSGSDNHQITSDNVTSSHRFKLSYCYLPNSSQNIDSSVATIVDRIFSGLTSEVSCNDAGFIMPNRSSLLVNSGIIDSLEETDIRSHTDVLDNPRISGNGIDVGAIEVMKPELTISDTMIDFGMVDVFCVADSTIRIENTGTEDLELYSISLPTGYTVDQAFPLTVPTGYSSSSPDSLVSYIDLKVSFSPTRHQTDYLDKFITIATNDSLYQSVVIQVSGIGRAAELSMSDSTLVLGDFPANNTPSFGREFIIFKNTGNAELVIDSLQVTADFQYAISDSLEPERKSTVLAPIERNSGSDRSRGTPSRQSSSSMSLASVATSPYQRQSSSPRSLDYVKNLTWHGFGQMQQLSISPGDSVFVHTRYIPYQIKTYSGEISLISNDPYDHDRTIELSGQGIPLVVTDNPSETQISNIIVADTLWTCPKIEVKSDVEVGTQARLTIRPYKIDVSVVADSTTMFRVQGELHARRSLNQLFGVSFAGVDSLSGWKGFVFKDNSIGISRMDSVYVYNANDYNRLDAGGGAIHTKNYQTLYVNYSVFQGNQSQATGGSVHLENGAIHINKCDFRENAAILGGAVSVIGTNSELYLTSTTLSDNFASQSGGAVFIDNANASISCSELAANVSLSGGAISIVGSNSDVSIAGGQFQLNGGDNTIGGAVSQSGGQLVISDDTLFDQNSASHGGAIAVSGIDATATIEDVIFNSNKSFTTGGAIFTEGSTISVDNATFTSCSSQSSGGAIYAEDSSIEVQNSTFEQCKALSGNGGAITLLDSDYLISLNKYIQCHADSLNGKGGALFISNSVSRGTADQTKIASQQRLLRSNLITQSQAALGGALYQTGDGEITSNAMYDNRAINGAGIYLVRNTAAFDNNTIASNKATVYGGAMVCDSLSLTLKNSLLWGNSQSDSLQIHCIAVQTLNFINCNVQRITAADYGVSGSYTNITTLNCLDLDPLFDENNSLYPFQLYKTSSCVNAGVRDFAIDGLDVRGNPRINASNGTAIIDIGAYEYKGPFWEYTGTTIDDWVDITYSPTRFINNLEVINTGTLHIDPGVTFLAQNNSMIIVRGSIDAPGTENSRIVFSTAPENPSWYGFRFLSGFSSSSSIFTYCTLKNGKAYGELTNLDEDTSNGGAFYIDGYPAIQIDYCSFSSNQALGSGGAIYIKGYSLHQINHCSFSSNQAFDSGGAIYITNFSPRDSLLIINSQFTTNKAKTGTGGAICSMDSKIHLQDNLFSLNTAGYPLDPNVTPEPTGFCGGAVSLINNGSVAIGHSVLDNQFHANSAAGTGGAIYAKGGLQRIIGNQFFDSIALGIDKSGSCSNSYGGGAIGVVSSAVAEINLNTFDSNYAYAGGAILNHNSVSNVVDNTFTGNKAQFGGAIQLIDIDTGNTLTRNLFTTNGTADSTTCEIGGAIRLHNSTADVDISLSKLTGNSCNGKGGAVAIQKTVELRLANNQISNNNALNGGGLYLEDSKVILDNNTIAHNVSSVSGGGIFLKNSGLESCNNLNWSNSSPLGFEVHLIDRSSMQANNCFLRQTPNAVVDQSPPGVTYNVCFGESDQSPQLMNESHNYNLKPDSPCVNNGNIDVYHTLTDLNLRSRIVGGRIDIGAYEYSGTTLEGSPVDSLTIWDDTCITIAAPITISEGKKLIIEDNVTVFFEANGSLYVENSTLEVRSNVSFVSETPIPAYHITLKNAEPVTLTASSVLGVKLKTETTFLGVENSIFNNSFLSHNNQSLVVRNSEFSASNLDAVNTSISNDTLMVSIVGSYFHDKPDSTAIRIYSYPSFIITDNTISNYYTGISLFESGQGKVFSLGGNNIEGNQYGYGIQAYHSNIEMNSSGSVKNNYIGLGGLRNSSLYLAGNKEPPYQSFCNNYYDEMAFTHDSFPKDIRFNLIYDSLHPVDTLIRCSNCDYSTQHDVSYNYWNLPEPQGFLAPADNYSLEPVWEMDENLIPEICADQDLFELAKYNLRIGHNDLAVIQFQDLIENYPDTKYKEDAAKLLMAAAGSCSDAIFDLQHFYATEPNLHNEIGIEKLADYLANYCNLKLEDYQSVIDWYEHIIMNPPSETDRIYAVIDLAYTYLLMNAADNRSQYVGKYSQYIPQSMLTFRRDLDGYISQLLQSGSPTSNVPPIPSLFALHQNYPNPFNPTTTISFEIPEDAPAQLGIYNIRGQLVKEFRYEMFPKGYHKLVWDGRDRNSRSVGSGVYFYRMTYKGKAITKKMCIIK